MKFPHTSVRGRRAILGALQLLKQTRTLPPAVESVITSGGQTDPLTSDELDALIASVKKGGSPRVVIVVDGGLVQEVITDIPVVATVVDFDVEGADEEDLTKVPEDRVKGQPPSEKDASISSPPHRVSAHLVTRMLKNVAK